MYLFIYIYIYVSYMCMTLIHSEDGLGGSDYNICVFVVRFTCIYVYINLHLYTGI